MDLLNNMADDDWAPYDNGRVKSMMVESDCVPVHICFFRDNLKLRFSAV